MQRHTSLKNKLQELEKSLNSLCVTYFNPMPTVGYEQEVYLELVRLIYKTKTVIQIIEIREKNGTLFEENNER